MARISALNYSEWSLKRKLFVYMLLLAVLLLAILAAGLVLFGRTNSTAEIYHDTLTMQMEVFEKDISAHFDHLAASAISLSEEMTTILTDTLDAQKRSFSDLTDSASGIAAVQAAMLEPLRQRLLQTNCSGAFVLLDATVNSALPEASCSKTGLYLQKSGYAPVIKDCKANYCYRIGTAKIAESAAVYPGSLHGSGRSWCSQWTGMDTGGRRNS